MVLDVASKETFLSLYQTPSFCVIHLPESQCQGLNMLTVIVIMPLFSFSNLLFLPNSFHSLFHPGYKMEVKISFLCELWY